MGECRVDGSKRLLCFCPQLEGEVEPAFFPLYKCQRRPCCGIGCLSEVFPVGGEAGAQTPAGDPLGRAALMACGPRL